MRGTGRKALAVLAVLAVAVAGSPAVGGAAPATNANLPPTLSSATGSRVGSVPKSVVVGDFTGDGLQDAVLATAWFDDPLNDNKLFLFAQTASGSLAPAVRLATGAASSFGFEEDMGMAAGDLDGDGRTDLVLALFAGVEVFLQRNGGLVRTALVDVPEAEEVSLADLDGDADLDLVVDRRTGVSTLAGTGTGSFGPPAAVVAIDYTELGTGDVTGDGRVDIVGAAGTALDVIARRVDGTFAEPVRHTVDDEAQALAVGDFNGDGRKDAAVSVGVTTTAHVQLFLQTAAGALAETDPPEAYAASESLVAADLNLDGRTDLVALHSRSQTVGVYTQGSDGILGDEDLYLLLSANSFPPTKGLAVGDVSGDGFPDLVVADRINGWPSCARRAKPRPGGLAASARSATAPRSTGGCPPRRR